MIIMDKLNFENLKNEIISAAIAAINEMRTLHPSEKIIAFALYSDESAMTVSNAINTLQHLQECQKEDPEHEFDYKFAPAEWKYEAEFSTDAFAGISGKVRSEVSKDETDFCSFKKQLFQTCFGALQEIKSSYKDDMLWLFAVSDSEITQQQIGWEYALNGDDTGKEFEEWATSFS